MGVENNYYLSMLLIISALPIMSLENTMFCLIIYWLIFKLKTANTYLFLVNLCFACHLIRNFMRMYIEQYFFFIKGIFPPSEANSKTQKANAEP